MASISGNNDGVSSGSLEVKRDFLSVEGDFFGEVVFILRFLSFADFTSSVGRFSTDLVSSFIFAA